MDKDEEFFSKERIGISVEDCSMDAAFGMPWIFLSSFLRSSDASGEAVGVAAFASVQQGAAST
jgi:hypothetical protein